MTIPMMVLAVGSGLLGLVLSLGGTFTHWLEPVVGGHEEGEHPVLPVWLLMTLTLLLVAGGVAARVDALLARRGAPGAAHRFAGHPRRPP